MREIIQVMENWNFTDEKGNVTQINLPHTWNGKDGQDGGNDYLRGTRRYDTVFPRPDFDKETQCVYLQFHGVNACARVILNEREVCLHEGGYSTFRTEITEFLQEENHLIVNVDNSINDSVYPQKADFTFYGGIYRAVEFMIVSKEHFDLEYYGGPGLKYFTKIVGNDAEVNVITYLNRAAKEAGASVKVELWSQDNRLVAEAKGTDANLRIEQVRLWKGLQDPYLYRIKAFLIKEGKTVDEIGCNCGVREFQFSPKDGFYLNGEPYPLHGVSRHQDYPGSGNAITPKEHDTDMELIREVGANSIRLAHYQHDQYFYDLCDKAGMIVWAEIPYISEHLPGGKENTYSQMKELIVQNINHPCIVTWGLSNEITISGGRYKKDMLDNHRKLQKLVKEMDPGRVTTLACYALCPPWHPVAHISDIVGWNLYLGWYVPGVFLNDLWITCFHFLYPNRCLCFSEYGAEGMPNLHSKKPRRGDNSEEYQNKYHEYMLKCFQRHPYLWGYYYWNMFDFAADARNQGGEPGRNHKGMVTFDRKVKKDVFYLYKAYWTDTPFVYIAGRRYEYRRQKVTEITVYSNRKEVSLYNNKTLVETKSGEKVFKFKMPMEEVNHLEVKAGDCRDSCVIYKTDKFRPEYKVKADSSNWM